MEEALGQLNGTAHEQDSPTTQLQSASDLGVKRGDGVGWEAAVSETVNLQPELLVWVEG